MTNENYVPKPYSYEGELDPYNSKSLQKSVISKNPPLRKGERIVRGKNPKDIGVLVEED